MKGKSAWKCVAVATVVAIAAGVQDFAEAADAPFGFVWSQKRESLPRPSSAQVDANITVLLYEGTTLPPPMKDTATVALKLCERYGLQQVRWASRLFGLSAVWLFRHVQDWRRPALARRIERNADSAAATQQGAHAQSAVMRLP